MPASKVFFSEMTSTAKISSLERLKSLLSASGMRDIDFGGKFVAVKTHFGEPGNMAYLRPNWARILCDYIKELGGRPFLTDCNTLYVGARKDALEHLDSAYLNGYSPLQTGVQVIIADGLRGTDEVLIPVEGGEYVKEAKIGRAIADADIVISLSHLKGHKSTGFGGAIKNLGMGCGSRAGKMEMHSNGRPFVAARKCVGCGMCVRYCAHDALSVIDGLCVVDATKCVGCGRCICMCPADAMHSKFDVEKRLLNARIAEYAKAVCHGKPTFHITLAIDITHDCDCNDYNWPAVVPDIGMFASFDPVALDRACADAVNAKTPVSGGFLDKLMAENPEQSDYFTLIHPVTSWMSCLEHGEKIGLGSMDYELVKI